MQSTELKFQKKERVVDTDGVFFICLVKNPAIDISIRNFHVISNSAVTAMLTVYLNIQGVHAHGEVSPGLHSCLPCCSQLVTLCLLKLSL